MTLQLSVRGEQDMYISGKPSITYFSSVYKRATPFVTEYVEYSFDNNSPASSSTTAIFTVPKRGDIITDICLKNIFSSLYPSKLNGYYYGKLLSTVLNVYAITTSGVAVLAFQTLVTGFYYSTVTLYSWVLPVVPDMSVSYSDSTQRMSFATTNINNYKAIGFADENSASFFGFNISSPTATSPSGILASFLMTGGTVSSNMTVSQSGWIPGFSPILDTTPYSYTDSYPLQIIKEARLYIGNQLISRIAGDYIKILKDYETGYENRSGTTLLNGMGDTSVKYLPTTTMTSLPFGIKNLPISSIYRQSVQVQIDFNPASSVLKSVTTDPFYISSSYTAVQTPSAQMGNVYQYNNTLIITENPTYYTTYYDTNTNIVTRNLTVNNIPFSGIIISGYMYSYDVLGATRISMTDYLTNTDSRVKSTINIWPYGVPAYQSLLGMTGDSRYVYYIYWLSAQKLTTTSSYVTLNYVEYLSSSIVTVYLTFYGVTTVSSNGVYTELVNLMTGNISRPATGYSGRLLSSQFIISETNDGTNCYVSARWIFNTSITSEQMIGTIAVVKYDTLADINSSSSYTLSADYLSTYTSAKMPPVQPTVASGTLRFFTDNINIYTITTSGIFIVKLAGFTGTFSTSAVDGLYAPTLNDGTYIYFSNYNKDGTIKRFRFSEPISSSSSWNTFDLYANFPSIFRFYNEYINQLTPGVFDGRYIYYAGALTASVASPVILRYDTSLPFTSALAYSIAMKQWGGFYLFTTDKGQNLNVTGITQSSPNAFIFRGPTSTQCIVVMNNISDPTVTSTLNTILQVNTVQLSDASTFIPSMLVEYAYVNKLEQDQFRKYSQNIVFELPQTMKFSLSPGVTSLPLKFLNPVKELYVYSNTYSNINTFDLMFNGDSLFTMSGNHLRNIEPIEYSLTTPLYNTYMYSFLQPVNMSRIHSKILTVSQASTTTLYVHAKSLNVLVIKDGLASVLFNSLEYIV